MSLHPETTQWRSDFISVLPELRELFDRMDKKYREAAQRCGFQCDGCADSCCRSVFYHHTFLEYFFIREGFQMLGSARRAAAKQRAEAVCNHLPADGGGGRPARLMCPLNFDGRCILYAYRPMICRLHGIPHEFRQPDGRVVTGPGCKVFSERFLSKDCERLNRTPFYFELAALEKEFKLKAGIAERMKMTVAEIICACSHNRS